MADAQTIDSLAIEITSQVKGEAKLQRFAKALNDLAVTSQAINTGSLRRTAEDIGMFSSALSGINTNGVKNFANALNRLSQIKADSTGGLNNLSKSIVNLTTSAQNTEGLTRLTNALARLSKADMSGFNGGAFAQMASTINSLVGSLSSAEQVDAGITRLVGAISKLGSSGQYIENVSKELPIMGTALTKLIVSLHGVGTIDAEIAKLVEGIARLANSGKSIPTVVTELDKFGDAVVRLVRKLQGIGTIDVNLANTIQGLGNLAASGMKFGNVAQTTSAKVSNLSANIKKLGSVVLRVINPFNSLRDKLGMTQKRTKGLASTIGLMYAKFFMLIRIGKGIGKSISSMQDYLESFNYFNVALQKIGKENAHLYKEYGYKDAKTYADSFQDRFTKLQKQMTGYDVNSRTGDLDFKASKSLGLNINDVMQYQAQIAQITNSTGQLGEVSIMAAKAMSMLSADMSSLTNTDLVQVQENFMSALNGQTRAVYKYGINLTSASLQQIAYNHGISESVAKMSMATKQQLRLIGMLEQSRVAWTDLAKTINQPANQLRMLQAGFANLGRTIGAIFLPALQAIYPVLNGIVMVLQEFFGWIAKLMGVEIPDMSAMKMPEIEQPADDMGNLADNTDKAAKKAKKLSDNLQGFDEINKLSENMNSDNGSSPLGNGMKDIDMSADLKKLMDEYERLWNKMFKSTENKAVKWAERIKKALLKGWNNGGDFTFLGLEFGQKLSELLAKIPWDKIQNGVNKVTKSFATFLNGVVKGTNWKTVGETIAQAFNTVIGALYTWYDTFDFLDLGKKLASGLNAMIKKINWKKIGGMLGKKLRGMIQFAFGFITNIDFENIGEKITVAINEFLKDMGAIDSRTGLSGWSELGKTISDGAKGLLDTIITVLEGVNWDAVAQAIADFMSSVDWFGILGKLAKAIGTALWKLITTGLDAFFKDPASVGGGLLAIFGTLFAWNKLKGLLGIVSGGFGRLFSTGLKQGASQAVSSVGSGKGLFGSLFSKLGASFKATGTSIASKFAEGFAADGLGGGLLATGGATVATGASVAILGAAAAGTGMAIGHEINKAIDARQEATESARNAGKMRGNATMTVASDGGRDLSNIEKTYSTEMERLKKLKEKYSKEVKESIPSTPAGWISNWFSGDYEQAVENLEKVEAEMTGLNYKYAELKTIKNGQEHERQEKALAKLQRMVKKGEISWYDYVKAQKKVLASQGSVKELFNQGLLQTEKYQGITKKLADSLTQANVPMEQQKAIMGVLRQAVSDGRISLEKYESIVKKCKGDVNLLNKEIGKIPPKKNVKVNFGVSGFNSVMQYLNAIPRSIPVNVQVSGAGGRQVSNEEYRSRTAVSSNAIMGSYDYENNLRMGNIKIAKDGTIKMKKFLYEQYKANGKLKQLIHSGYRVKKFAKGGFLEDGLFTMNKGEMAGRFDSGKSVVANNQQITQGFAQGITATLAPAIYSAVKQAMSESTSDEEQNINVYLDGRQLAQNSVKYIRQMERSNGTKAFA